MIDKLIGSILMFLCVGAMATPIVILAVLGIKAGIETVIDELKE